MATFYRRSGTAALSDTFWLDLYRSLGGRGDILVLDGTTPNVTHVDPATDLTDLVDGGLYGDAKAGNYGGAPSQSHPVTIFLPPGRFFIGTEEWYAYDVRKAPITGLSWNATDKLIYGAAGSNKFANFVPDERQAFYVYAPSTYKKLCHMDLTKGGQGEPDGIWYGQTDSMDGVYTQETLHTSNISGTVALYYTPVLQDSALTLDTPYLNIVGCGAHQTTIAGRCGGYVLNRTAEHVFLGGLSVENVLSTSDEIAQDSYQTGAIGDRGPSAPEDRTLEYLDGMTFDCSLQMGRVPSFKHRGDGGYAVMCSTLVCCRSRDLMQAAFGHLVGGTMIDCEGVGGAPSSMLGGGGIFLMRRGLILGCRLSGIKANNRGSAVHQCGATVPSDNVVIVGSELYSDSHACLGDGGYVNLWLANCSALAERDVMFRQLSLNGDPCETNVEGGVFDGSGSNALFMTSSRMTYNVYGSPSLTNRGTGGIWDNPSGVAWKTGSMPIPQLNALPGVYERMSAWKSRNRGAIRRAALAVVREYLQANGLGTWLKV